MDTDAGPGNEMRRGARHALTPARYRRATRFAIVVLAFGALVLPPTANADWPVYGHDLSNSRDAGADGPSPSEVATMSQAWAFRSSTGDFTGTPVVAGGVLVAGDNTRPGFPPYAGARPGPGAKPPGRPSTR